MKNAFTMLELIAVIVITGILAAVMIPRFSDDKLQEAADQVISHIRYTQHLAMMDDKFISNSNYSDESSTTEAIKNAKYWYKSLWEIQFHTTGSYAPTYSIYSDSPSSTSTNAAYDGNPRNADKIAIDPQNGLHMSGLASTTSGIPDTKIDNMLRLNKKYGITSMNVANNCGTHRFLFDKFGRPYCSTPTSGEINKYFFDANDLLTATATITISNGANNKTIYVEPETGYVHF